MSEKLLINEDKSNNFEVKSNKVVIANSATTKEKQIEEMANDIKIAHDEQKYLTSDKSIKAIAEHLYNAGYRKHIDRFLLKENGEIIPLSPKQIICEGEWKYQFTLDGDRFYECSVCGRQVVINCLCNKKRNASEFYPYCHCGAKMKGGEE